jgi:hypothetical protein
MKFAKINLLMLFLLTGSSIIYSQKKNSDWINGTWRGTGFQLDNNTSWSVRFEANIKSKSFLVDYGSLNCGGIWELIEIDGNRAKFIEKITKGKENCLNGSTIIITFVAENYISYSCFSPGGKKLDACSTLERTE